MKGGMQISPAVGGVLVVILLAVAIFGLYKITGPKGKVQLSGDQVKQMQEMMGKQKADVAGSNRQHSLPPGGAPSPQ